MREALTSIVWAMMFAMGCSTSVTTTQPFVLDTGITTSKSWGPSVGVLNKDQSYAGDLSRGEVIDLDFAHESTMACWTATEDQNFSGPHQFFALTMAANRTLTVDLDSQPGVDANLYVIQVGTTIFTLPPDLMTAVTCEAAYPMSTDSNPGAVDSAVVTTFNNPYNVIVGVAGAQGHESGGFVLDVTTTVNQ
jgi:CelD/BcsL family acetyltransferase involved in cellulose biosynthesis